MRILKTFPVCFDLLGLALVYCDHFRPWSCAPFRRTTYIFAGERPLNFFALLGRFNLTLGLEMSKICRHFFSLDIFWRQLWTTYILLCFGQSCHQLSKISIVNSCLLCFVFHRFIKMFLQLVKKNLFSLFNRFSFY